MENDGIAKKAIINALETMKDKIKEKALEAAWKGVYESDKIAVAVLHKEKESVIEIEKTIVFLNKNFTEQQKTSLTTEQRVLLLAIETACKIKTN